jgi:hypothetical protein
MYKVTNKQSGRAKARLNRKDAKALAIRLNRKYGDSIFSYERSL